MANTKALRLQLRAVDQRSQHKRHCRGAGLQPAPARVRARLPSVQLLRIHRVGGAALAGLRLLRLELCKPPRGRHPGKAHQQFCCGQGEGSAGLVGSLPEVVPENSLAGGSQANNKPGLPPDGLHFLAWPGDPVWEIAGGMIAHESWTFTGDTTVLEQGYASLKALVEFFHRKGNTQPDGLTTFGFEGDWLGVEGCYPQRSRAWSLPNTGLKGCLLSNMSSATAQIVATSQLADMAAVLKHDADHARYSALAAQLRSAYHAAFYDNDAEQYRGNGTHTWQFANLMPIALNITPPKLAASVLDKLTASIRSGAHGACSSSPCIATGFWGTRFMLQTLSRFGEHELAMELATKTEEPSWGYFVSAIACLVRSRFPVPAL